MSPVPEGNSNFPDLPKVARRKPWGWGREVRDTLGCDVEGEVIKKKIRAPGKVCKDPFVSV